MNFLELKKRAAKELNLLDSSDDILTGKDITEAKIGQSINDAYVEEIVPVLMGQYPQDYEQTSVAPNYTVTGTADSTSTGTTLIATTSIFNLGMVGLYVENYTDTTYAKITGYTNGTTVTLNTTIGNDWDGDSLRIINNKIAIGGNATDYSTIKRLDIRKTSSSDYLKATPRFYNDVFLKGTESIVNPIYILTTTSVSGTPTKTLAIYPTWTASDDYAIKMRYLQKPTELSSDSDVPNLPLRHQKFIM